MNTPPSAYSVINTDCRKGMKQIDSSSIDAIITDPPYACIDRDYGYWTEKEWRDLMDDVVQESRRVLQPSGSAVFILQANSEKVGRVRPWLYRFMADYAEDWNLVFEVFWWNHTAPPNVHCQRRHGLLRPSLKYCLWFGDPECYRNQDAVLWSPSAAQTRSEQSANWDLRISPSGYSSRPGRFAQTVQERGGVTPYNVLPIANNDSRNSAAAYGHGAGTPLELCDWWSRYIVPEGGTSLDPFCGTGTTGVAAVTQGKRWIGIEQDDGYARIAEQRVRDADMQNRVFN